MPSQMYGLAKESLLSQSPSIDFDTDTIKIALVTGAYTRNTATNGHQYFSSVGTNAIATATLTSKTVVGGVFDAADVTFSSVSGTHTTVTQLVIYKDTGTATNSPLIAILDGISIAPNGGDIVVSFDNGANKIFALV